MANIKSSKKAIKVIAKKTDNNHEAKAKVKNLIKDMKKYVDPKTDSIRIYKLNRDNEILNFGINKLTDLNEIKIL